MLVHSWLYMLELANVWSLRLPSSHPLHQVRSKSATSQRQQQDVGWLKKSGEPVEAGDLKSDPNPIFYQFFLFKCFFYIPGCLGFLNYQQYLCHYSAKLLSLLLGSDLPSGILHYWHQVAVSSNAGTPNGRFIVPVSLCSLCLLPYISVTPKQMTLGNINFMRHLHNILVLSLNSLISTFYSFVVAPL